MAKASGLLMACACGLIMAGGCTIAPAPPAASSAASAAQTSPASPTTPSAQATAALPPTPTPPALSAPPEIKQQSSPQPSRAAIAYAKRLGGVSHEGERLYFIVGDSVGSGSQATKLLDAATPRFGDMQSYFIVQRSDNFDGMRPGWWVLIEAHRTRPTAEDIAFAKRGFRDCYVKSATVRTSEPIPVYDDLVGK